MTARSLGSVTPQAIARDTAEHYTWGDGNDGWHLVKTPILSVIHERMQPGRAEIPHHHERAHQYFHVVEGTLTMLVGEQRYALQPGHGISIPPGARHQARNESDAATEFLVVSAPPSHGDRVS